MSKINKYRAWREDIVSTEPYGRNSFEQKFMENDIEDIKTRKFDSFEERGFVKAHRADIMQYIGIDDKNGKEIYEGDIVKIDGYRELFVVKFVCDTVRYVLQSKDELLYFEFCIGSRVEVIGNVYENADLLKEVDRNE